MTTNKFHEYTEAKYLVNTLPSDFSIEITEDMTLNELVLIAKDFHNWEYQYSVYTHDLLAALAGNLDVFSHLKDIEIEGINLDNIMMINYGLEQCILDMYGDKTLDYFEE